MSRESSQLHRSRKEARCFLVSLDSEEISCCFCVYPSDLPSARSSTSNPHASGGHNSSQPIHARTRDSSYLFFFPFTIFYCLAFPLHPLTPTQRFYSPFSSTRALVTLHSSAFPLSSLRWSGLPAHRACSFCSLSASNTVSNDYRFLLPLSRDIPTIVTDFPLSLVRNDGSQPEYAIESHARQHDKHPRPVS